MKEQAGDVTRAAWVRWSISFPHCVQSTTFDKAKVEVAVQVATRWIIAKLRNIRFFSLVELNAAIRDCVTALNDRVSRHLGARRCALFEALDHPALKPLPTPPYVYPQSQQSNAPPVSPV